MVINYYDDPNIKWDEEGWDAMGKDGGGAESWDDWEIWTDDNEDLPNCESNWHG